MVPQPIVHTVYLRVCGGIRALNKIITEGRGLSPRVRRHLCESLDAKGITRSISACAEASA